VLADIGLAPPSGGYFGSIYVPATDSLYLSLEGNIVTARLNHASVLEISSFLWLPVSEGTLAIAGLAGAVVAVMVHLRRSHYPKPAV
jgi:hypothetical protein